MSRRRALVLGGLGTASLAGGLAGWFAQASQPTRDPAAADQAQGSWVGDTGARLGEPVPLESRDGRLQATLIAGPGARLAGRDTAALGYNATSPGPTLRARPGDVLALRLVNHLDQPTNLHTHGLRVSPGANSDNPFIQIAPGETFDYVFHIPPNHPAGTFWYHPHRHGTTADQLFGGLAGALLIMPDTPELAAAEDRVLLITDTTLDDAGRVAPAGPMAKMMGRQGALVLLNGQHQPVIPAVPAATQRWRLINGCASRILSLRLAGHQLTQIALDGSFLPAPTAVERVLLAPGNRADVLVHPENPGGYGLIADTVEAGMSGMGMRMGPMMDGSDGPVTLATMRCAGAPRPSPAPPPTLPAEALSASPVTETRRITLQMGMGMGAGMGGMGSGGMGMVFAIDGRQFDPSRDDQTSQLGAIEEWLVTNTSPMTHPFHLHTHPFVVLAGSDATRPAGVAQDVVLVPAHGWVRLRIGFSANPGRSVYHCHVADHSDAGMMATLNLTPTT